MGQNLFQEVITLSPKQESLIRRIYLGRQMLFDALQIAGQNLPIARMRCILSLDHAVEMIAVTLLSELGITVDRNWSLPKMLEELSERKEDLKSYRQPIERLRRLRDRVQHDGVVPSPEDIRQFVGQVEAFIRDAIREVLGKELEECSLVSLVADEQAREHLKNSEEALARNDFRGAVKEVAISFAFYWRNFRDRVYLYRSWTEHIADKFAQAIGDAAREAARKTTETNIRKYLEQCAKEFAWQLRSFKIREVFEQLAEPLELARYGVDMTAYSRFQGIAPRVFWVIGGKEPLVFEPSGWSPTQQDALFALDFVCTALLQLQSCLETQGEIERSGETSDKQRSESFSE